MHKLDQKGAMNPLLIPIILAAVFMLAFAGVGVVYYGKYIEQKDNNQPLIEAAVTKAEEAQKLQLEAEFVEREKQPYDTYTGPAELGTLKLTYPKTWSAYVDTTKGALDFFAHPFVVPSEGVKYALRASVIKKSFADEIKGYDSQVKKGELRATAVQVAGTQGVRFDGLLEKDVEGSMVVFPLRDKTLRVWTETKDFEGDFNNIVLKNLSFVP